MKNQRSMQSNATLGVRFPARYRWLKVPPTKPQEIMQSLNSLKI